MTQANLSTPSESGRIAARWPVLLAILVGVACGMPGVAFYSLGALVKPLEAQFGWSRPAIQAALIFSTGGGALAAPLIGRLADRYGVKIVGSICLALLGACLAACALASANIWWLYGCYAAAAIAGSGASPVVWTLAVNRWFSTQRGLALGIALSGTGICATILPKLVGELAQRFGWKAAYLALAAAPVLVALPLVVLCLPSALPPRLAAARAPARGVSLGQALRGARLWLLAASAFAVYAGGTGLIGNLVPLFTDRGLTVAQATNATAALGLSSTASRLVTGALIDRFWAPGVGMVLMTIAALAVLLIGDGGVAPDIAILVAAALGLVAGAELDLVSYLTARYFGPRAYGRIYGVIYATFAIAGGLAPLTFARMGEHMAIGLVSGLLLTGGVLMLCLGRYPTFAGIAETTSPETGA